MNILYYCPEYYSRHGGRAHARGFFGALKKLPSVSESFLYPRNDPQIHVANAGNRSRREGRLWFLPQTLRRIVQFFIPKRELTRALIREVKTNACDALVIRTGVTQPTVSAIKRACPQTVVCLEINSTFFSEMFHKLPLRSLFQRWEVSRFRQADAIVVVSSYLKDYIQERGICPEKIFVNQNGVNAAAVDLTDVSDLRPRYSIPKDAFVIGYIGGMETFRRLPEVIGDIAELRRAGNHDIYLLMVGDGSDMPAVQAAIERDRAVLDHAVVLTGWQPFSEVPGFLATFDIAIFPFTNAYCSPLKLFEYLAAGVPTIGPDTPAVREVFQDGVHLRLVKQDGSDFVSTILEMKANPQLRAELSAKGRQLVLEEYTWERNAERIVQHIQALRQKTACGD